MRPDCSRWNWSRSSNAPRVRVRRGRLALNNDGPDFDGAFVGGGDLSSEGDHFVEIMSFDQEEASKLFFGFSEGAIGRQTLAVPDANGCRGGSWLQLAAAEVLPCLLQVLH